MSLAVELIEGVVLCQVAGHRLAVRAQEVSSFDEGELGAPYAGHGFDASSVMPEGARLLRHHGNGLVVDSVEVHAERLELLPVPRVISNVWGGALAGFIQVAGQLWPLVALDRLPASPQPEAAS
ncbi:MAG: hypothetical protein ACO1OB_28940 [Archangium sp.]